ncbi:glycogen debranching protein GlgX [Luteolibacter sp. GHJ8]|uniref:Glycogen debranching protein GlgX n=1 Tax=Luteolibacter rhizosphaerae TaxID=2989719 RepID=A0ABT3FZH1_9BACT|nr:glycogen debranching protein GlgX [Luteolibacter rhizosphaerae]MCW1912963.1 glycogen debranching protein GlgX [Luteolibacter rhizosphaerae]
MHQPNRSSCDVPEEPVLDPGSPFPQGATWTGEGVNFSLFAERAEIVELCLFNHPSDTEESRRIRLTQKTNGIWHCFLPDLGPGQLYGYRVHGPYDPTAGLRYNPNKLLLDPYAKGIGRALVWDDALFGYTVGHEDGDLSFDTRDSAPFAPLGCVIDGSFDWGDDKAIQRPWCETIVYETHVRGFSMKHPQILEEMRGTYAALGSPEAIAHFQKLGVTAIELMPIHHFIQDRHLLERGLSNYWGYNSLGYFAPEPSYGGGGCPHSIAREFKQMVKSLHAAGLEVILDVVYNHTAEGSELGPTLSFRGIDNHAYYRLAKDAPRYYMDYTGCGNTLNMVHPHSLRLLMDSLRYWVTEMHVDGFRFDLASALARELHEVNQLGPFFDAIYQDPVLALVKLIAEPWDLGEGGYQVGNFPPGWTEWNGKYRDTVRRFWKGEHATGADLATRLSGSADLYETTGRKPSASINFVTAHDGFTMRDLVSYENKHNEANGEGNADGLDQNDSWNCGAEGETGDPGILQLRARQQRNLLATLIFSQGVPMISGGDEIGRTQHGNNNGYCQGNELTWYDWQPGEAGADLLEFTRRVVSIRRGHPNLRRHSFREEDPLVAPGANSLAWLRSDGVWMGDNDWEEPWIRTLGVYLAGTAPEIRDDRGNRVPDDDFILLLNAHDEPLSFALPDNLPDGWTVALDTAAPDTWSGRPEAPAELPVQMSAHSLVLLRHAR